MKREGEKQQCNQENSFFHQYGLRQDGLYENIGILSTGVLSSAFGKKLVLQNLQDVTKRRFEIVKYVTKSGFEIFRELLPMLLTANVKRNYHCKNCTCCLNL